MVLISFSNISCANEATTPYNVENNVQHFEGVYLSDSSINFNFEDTKVSSFVPTGVDEEPGAGKGYWLVPNEEFIQQYNKELSARLIAIASTYGPCDKLAIRVKFEGVLSPPAAEGMGYGHMSLYEREVRVTRVLEVKYFWVSVDDLCISTIYAMRTQAAAFTPHPTRTEIVASTPTPSIAPTAAPEMVK